ncbi:DUF5906 domain-containing protein, partial [Geminocystis sp. CENA526]|uniref:DUF5906 domain-containing protein n=1 Tax=Geminocystis sp. CENA526 TaxID=1355871 RepID=UPI003D6FB9CE
CLDEPYKSLFVKSLSTILEFKTIKEEWDRIKALLLIGDGSNGKDTLREVISLILGEQGITSCSLNDFSQSRGFNLARLATNPKLNWSSENKEINIDSIQSLKQAITGDPLFIEGKGKDGFEVKLNTLFVFNTNHKPDLKGNQFAIQSRLTLIPFTKTYSMNPKQGELKADPRFKHNKNFLVNEVAPALLNLLIDAYGEVYKNGINYQESENYFNEVIEDNNHLRRFAKEFGLIYTGNDDDQLSIGDIYSYLTEYYFNHGYLDFEETSNGKKKSIWADDDKRDPVVKNSNKLKSRILELFPKVKEYSHNRKKYLCGLKFELDSLDSYENAESIDNKEFEDTHVDSFQTHKQTHSLTHTDSFCSNNHSKINDQVTFSNSELNKQEKPDLTIDQNEKNESTESKNESTNESKMSQDMSLNMSQQKPENANKINSFQNSYESTLEKVSQEKNENESETKKESLLKKVEYREAVQTINDYLEQVQKITDKNEKRSFVGNFLAKEISSICDLSDQELIKLYQFCISNEKTSLIVAEKNDPSEQQKPDFKIGDKIRSCGNAIYEIVQVNDNDSVEGKCLEYSEFPEFIGQTLNIKNKQIKEIVESSLFNYCVGEKVYVLDNGKGNWLSATVEQNYGYGVKVKLDGVRVGSFLMIANSNSICRKVS